MRRVIAALVFAFVGDKCANAFTPAAPNGPAGNNRHIAASSTAQATPTHQLSSWASSIENIASRLDAIIWGGRTGTTSDAAAIAATATPHAVDEEVLRRRGIRHSIVEKRRRSLELEAELQSLLRIAGGKPSKMELNEVHRLSGELEALQAAEAAAAAAAAEAGVHIGNAARAGGGAWRLLFAETARSGSSASGVLLRRVLRRSGAAAAAAAAIGSCAVVTYASQNLRIERGTNGELRVFRRLLAAPECACADGAEQCCSSGEQWFWPL
ncbi:hypothetical protein JKP88DRAFT_347958 [Tribonema minus]|uniref:Uncharacterized protein n=1 Tax=Tribonema minus TaxID=303371 RepID=A0A835Z5I7_9STRA|nr:hypothetical protein JKP88DRAFT_347958 [Tribonema minus]